MARYGKIFKDRAVARLFPPESAPVQTVSQELGVSVGTLERWRADALSTPARERVWTAAARLQAVITTGAMDEIQRSTWCRENGVYSTELEQWKQNAVAVLTEGSEERASPQETRDSRKRIKELERDLRRKDKALAETAALLVLSKHNSRRFSSATRKNVEDRQIVAARIAEAHRKGARLKAACELAGIDVRTLQHWQHDQGLQRGDRRPHAVRGIPAHALSVQERERILQIANEPRSLSCRRRASYRCWLMRGSILPANPASAVYSEPMGRYATGPGENPPAQTAAQHARGHVATGPRQLWSWDLTFLASRVVGRWFICT